MLAIVGQLLYDGTASSLSIIGTTYAGVTMATLLGVRWAGGGYIDRAEDVGTWRWIDKDNDSGKEDEILLTRFGNEPIGAIVMRGVKTGDTNGTGSPRKRRQNSGGTIGKTKGVIRGWTVKNRYRRKGVGLGLLEEAVQICADKGWSGPVFADDHANSGRVLPAIFNGGFDKRDRKARSMLGTIVEDGGGSPTSSGGRGAKDKR